MNLVPSVLCSAICVSFDDLVTFNDEDLPNPSLVATEILRWKAKWEGQDAEDQPATLRTAIKQCDQDFFPNMYRLVVACLV